MKKEYILILLLAVIGLTSCDKPTVKNKDLPIEIVNLKETNTFDTVLVIKSDKQTYLFENKSNKYIGAYGNTNSEDTLFLLGVVFGLSICTLVLAIVFS